MEAFQYSQQFDSMDDLRLHLKQYSMVHNCPYYLKYSQPARLEARCPSEQSSGQQNACPFHLTAYKWKDGYVRLKKVQMEHSVECLATRTASASTLKNKVTP